MVWLLYYQGPSTLPVVMHGHGLTARDYGLVFSVNGLLIVWVMIPSFSGTVFPQLPSSLGTQYYAVATVHGVLGLVVRHMTLDGAVLLTFTRPPGGGAVDGLEFIGGFAGTPAEDVVSGPAVELVVARAATDEVVARAAEHPVVAGAREDAVVTALGVDRVVPGHPGDEVRPGCADDRVVAIGAPEDGRGADPGEDERGEREEREDGQPALHELPPS